jgi:hypothetical protein
MDDKEAARLVGFSRLLIGALIWLFPGFLIRSALGESNDTEQMRSSARRLGGRDMALGAGLVVALENDEPAGGWLAAGAFSDASDAFSSLVYGDDIPRVTRLMFLATEVSFAYLGFKLATSNEI